MTQIHDAFGGEEEQSAAKHGAADHVELAVAFADEFEEEKDAAEEDACEPDGDGFATGRLRLLHLLHLLLAT